MYHSVTGMERRHRPQRGTGRRSTAGAAALLLIAWGGAALAQVPRVPAQAAPAFQCRGTVYCREMRSCEEAMFHLQRCGQARLDADRDGIPCEANACTGRAPRQRMR